MFTFLALVTLLVDELSGYELFSGADRRNWVDAEVFCQERGGHLVSIHDADTNTQIANDLLTKLDSQVIWIGFNQITNTWTDGSIHDYTANLIQNPQGECTAIIPDENDVRYNGWWMGPPCENQYPFICDIPALECPSGSVAAISLNAGIVGCGLETCDVRYNKADILECKVHCESTPQCNAFSFAPIGGDINHLNAKVCTIYNTNLDSTSYEILSEASNAILCGLPASHQECETQYSLSGYDTDLAVYRYTGGCQQHFEYGLNPDRTGALSLRECSRQCIVHSEWCRSFAYGKGDANKNWCYLYGGICEPMANGAPDWDIFTPILNNDAGTGELIGESTGESTWQYTGGCEQHFEYGLDQDKSGTLSAKECSDRCINSIHCQSFAFGKTDANRNWCNLYSGICSRASTEQPDRYSSWDMGVKVLNSGTSINIPMFTGGCAQHFQYGLDQDNSGTLSRQECSNQCAQSIHCQSFSFGRQGSRSGWCNKYNGVCTNGGGSDWKDWDTYKKHKPNSEAICNGY